MKTINCFDLHNHVLLNDDNDLQEAYDKLYKEFIKSFRKSTEAKLENVRLKFRYDSVLVEQLKI